MRPPVYKNISKFSKQKGRYKTTVLSSKSEKARISTQNAVVNFILIPKERRIALYTWCSVNFPEQMNCQTHDLKKR